VIHHGVKRAGRRVRQTLTAFENGPSVLVDMARHADELTFRFDGGRTISLPNVPGARVPVYEILAEDAYRLEWFTADLPTEFGVLDIGGHVGCFSVALAALRPGARVWTFEASPSTAAYTQRNVQQNGFADRVTVRNVAVSATAGTLEFADNGGGSGLNGITAPAGAARISVPAITFGDAKALADVPVRLVKIDTEGAEYDIVLGSAPEQWRDVERVVLEYHDVPGRGWPELESFFSAAGLSEVAREDTTERLGTVWLSRKQ
jgi:FkbM family methyltransferase